jgi:hypothetical protein
MSPLIDINSAMSSQTMGVEEVETGIVSCVDGKNKKRTQMTRYCPLSP